MMYSTQDKVAMSENCPIPMRSIGPVRITGPVIDDDVMVPLATYESPLWPSTNRGARVTSHAGGINTVVTDERMSRSILLEAKNAEASLAFTNELERRRSELEAVVAGTSRFGRLRGYHVELTANLIFLRLELCTGDAAGHNMVTLAADRVMIWILEQWPDLAYVSISGNFCTDKKVSAVNGILGRGKHVICESNISTDLCARFLKTTPDRLVDLNIKKNLIGTALAGGVRSANAHFANMLLAFYLATGQDAANIIEGSQGFVHAENRDDVLYFAVTIPNVIVGTVGAGKDSEVVQANLEQLGCLVDRETGANARRLAAIAAATVLCGELSLLAAQTNPGELMKAHCDIERAK
jgi:hydroxymethylglutaryl-CoA reductase (NADPH)